MTACFRTAVLPWARVLARYAVCSAVAVTSVLLHSSVACAQETNVATAMTGLVETLSQGIAPDDRRRRMLVVPFSPVRVTAAGALEPDPSGCDLGASMTGQLERALRLDAIFRQANIRVASNAPSLTPRAELHPDGSEEIRQQPAGTLLLHGSYVVEPRSITVFAELSLIDDDRSLILRTRGSIELARMSVQCVQGAQSASAQGSGTVGAGQTQPSANTTPSNGSSANVSTAVSIEYPTATVYFDFDPVIAQVRVDGELQIFELHSPVSLRAGTHHLDIFAEGYYSRRSVLTVEPRQTYRYRVNLMSQSMPFGTVNYPTESTVQPVQLDAARASQSEPIVPPAPEVQHTRSCGYAAQCASTGFFFTASAGLSLQFDRSNPRYGVYGDLSFDWDIVQSDVLTFGPMASVFGSLVPPYYGVLVGVRWRLSTSGADGAVGFANEFAAGITSRGFEGMWALTPFVSLRNWASLGLMARLLTTFSSSTPLAAQFGLLFTTEFERSGASHTPLRRSE